MEHVEMVNRKINFAPKRTFFMPRSTFFKINLNAEELVYKGILKNTNIFFITDRFPLKRKNT
jgi:hypothetical protein